MLRGNSCVLARALGWPCTRSHVALMLASVALARIKLRLMRNQDRRCVAVVGGAFKGRHVLRCCCIFCEFTPKIADLPGCSCVCYLVVHALL
jgi:hypothetical protein